MIQVFRLICFWAKTKWTYVQRNVTCFPQGETPICWIYCKWERVQLVPLCFFKLFFSIFLSLIIDNSLLTLDPQPVWLAGGSHGVPTSCQVIHREEGADWRRAAEPPCLGATGAPPQATGIVGPAPKGGTVEITAVPLVGFRSTAGKRMRLIHSALRGADGLPAGGRSGQWLPLCKETVDFLLTGKFSQNSSVPQNTPAERHQMKKVCAVCVGMHNCSGANHLARHSSENWSVSMDIEQGGNECESWRVTEEIKMD